MPRQQTRRMNKIITLTAFGWGIILLSLFVYTDLMLPSVNQNSDYLMTFYTAGELVREGNTGALYPPLGSDTFIDTAFDKAAHNVLPLLPPRATAEYMYMPAVAGMFVPLSMVGPGISLLLWQVVCLASLAACTFLFSGKFKLGGSNENESSRLSTPAFWLALTLVPLAISIWIGQISVVFWSIAIHGRAVFCSQEKRSDRRFDLGNDDSQAAILDSSADAVCGSCLRKAIQANSGSF